MSDHKTTDKTVKYCLLSAVLKGEIGEITVKGVVINTAQFNAFFSELNARYRTAFLPAAVIEVGRCGISHSKYLTRLSRGVYLIHEEALMEHSKLLKEEAMSVS